MEKLLIGLILSAYVILAQAAVNSDGPIVSYNLESFEQALENNKYVLVNFKTTWSQPSRAFEPIFLQAAEIVSQGYPELQVGVFDATMQVNLNEKLNILSFPTTKLFIKGNRIPLQYLGPQDASELIKWVHQKIGRISSNIGSLNDIKAISEGNSLVVLFIGSYDSRAFENYVNAARYAENVVFLDGESQEIRQAYEIPEDSLAIVALTNNGQDVTYYTKSMLFDDIRKFINGQRYPLVASFDNQARYRIFEADEDVAILLRNKDEAGEAAREEFEAAASELRSEFGFVEAIMGENLEVTFFSVIKNQIPGILEVTRADLPLIAIIKGHDSLKKYTLIGDVTKGNIISFLHNFRDGKIVPYIQTAGLPDEKYEDDVRTVVGRDFSKVVFDDNRNVFMRFCTQNLPKCSQIINVTNQLATKLKDVDGLFIAAMDTMYNHVSLMNDFDIPALVLFPENDKKSYIRYSGQVTEAALIEFLETNTGLKLSDVKEGGIEAQIKTSSSEAESKTSEEVIKVSFKEDVREQSKEDQIDNEDDKRRVVDQDL